MKYYKTLQEKIVGAIVSEKKDNIRETPFQYQDSHDNFSFWHFEPPK